MSAGPMAGQALQQAIQLHQAGRLQEAEAGYRDLLKIQPNHADAHHNLGVLLAQTGRLADAISHMAAATEASPGYEQYWFSCADALIAAQEFERARLLPGHAKLRGLSPEAATRLGAHVGKELQAAREGRAQALAEALAMNDRANALRSQGLLQEAESLYRQALVLGPESAGIHYNLGILLWDQERLDDAQQHLKRATLLEPGLVPAHESLGLVLKALGRPHEAEMAYRQALSIEPLSASLHNNLGSALYVQNQAVEAEQSFRRALQLVPESTVTEINLGIALQVQGRLSEAQACFRRALALDPQLETAHTKLLFALNYDADKTAEEIFASYRDYDAVFAAPRRAAWRPHLNIRDPARRLKVGYVSPDFRKHACEYFLEPLLERHDRQAFELHAYSELGREDEVTARYRHLVDHWRNTRGVPDQAVADRIRADGIDILIDLAGHTDGNRLGVFALKPAPVSLTWLGFGYSTGLTAIDYFLTDGQMVPAGSEHLFSEQPWRLQGPCFTYRPPEGIAPPGPSPAVAAGHVTFLSLSRAVRLNWRTIKAWSEVLRRLPTARLAIDNPNFKGGSMQQQVLAKFAAHGIGADRLAVGSHSPPWAVLDRADIGLDCFPHNNATTVFENLYMGVPFVTLAGRPSVGRLGTSILEGAGCGEWVAHSEQEFVDKAVALASDVPALAEHRRALRGRLQASALMDEAGFARRVEQAYRQMFKRWALQP